MSIKYRIPLMLAATMLLFAGCMYLFFLFYQNNVQQMIDRFTSAAEDASSRIALSGGSGPSLQESMEEGNWPDRIGILITTEQGGLAYLRDSAADNGINLRFTRQVRDTDGVLYRLTLEQGVDLTRVNVRTEMARVSLFATAMLLLTLLGMLLYLHHSVSRPLMSLRRRMDALPLADAHGGGERMGIPEIGRSGDEIILLDQGFERMQTALAAGRRARDEMVASISHDLRNPLTSILGYTERLLDLESSAPDERRSRYLNVIHDKAEDIATMIGEFHAYMEGEAGVLHPVHTDLSVFLASVAEEYCEELAGMGHPFAWSSDLPPGTMADVDMARMRRVFSNLIANSVRHGGPGVSIHMSFHLCGDEVACDVVDNGPGVPQEDLEKVFTFMYRSGGDRNRGRDKAGSGLGLTICKQIVNLHGGAINAYLPDGGGFAVRFTIRTRQGKHSSSA